MHGLGGGRWSHFGAQSCKSDDAQDEAMLEGPLIILNPNPPHCCPLPPCQGPHWGTQPPACELGHISSIFPILQPVCLDWHPPCVERHGPQAVSREVQNLVFLVGACRLPRTGCTRPFCRGLRTSNLHPGCTVRACPFPNQRLLWSIWCNSTWREFVCRHGGCLLTKGGSKQHKHHPKRTKISNISSV